MTSPLPPLDALLLHPTRLALVCALSQHPEPLEFSLLREDLELTGGNLLSHLRALEQAGVIQHFREAPLGRARTLYGLTPLGRERVRHHAGRLRDVAALLDGSVAPP